MAVLQAYSGFAKTRIEPFLHSPEMLYSVIGYRLNAKTCTFEIIDPPLTPSVRQRLAKTAFELSIAAVECEICNEIYQEVNVPGSGLQIADVYRCRSRKCGSVESFVIMLGESVLRKANDVESDCCQKLWRCDRCHRENLADDEVCRFCHFDGNGYLVPRYVVKPVVKSDSRQSQEQSVLTSHATKVHVHRSAHTVGGLNGAGDCVDGFIGKDERKVSDGDRGRKHLTADGLDVRYRSTMADRFVQQTSGRGAEGNTWLQIWQCDWCEAKNETSGNTCMQCNRIKPLCDVKTVDVHQRGQATQRGSVAASANRSEYGPRVPKLTEEKHMSWLCGMCGIENPTQSDGCLSCSSKRLDVSVVGRHHSLGTDCERKRTVEQVQKNVEASHQQLEKPILWQCAWCTFANNQKKDKCKICQNPRNTRPSETR
jgi:hypothetical protein